MKPKLGIYKITCHPNGKLYIGSSKDLAQRFRTHKKKLRKDIHPSPPLQNAWNKYGEQNFSFEIIESMEDQSQLIEREQSWIDSLKPQFNCRVIASSQLGMKHSEETKKKMSEASKRYWAEHGDEVRAKRRTPEGRQKNRERQLKSQEENPELKAWRSAVNERTRTPEVIAKMSVSQKKRWEDPEVKKEMSEKFREAWADPELRARHSAMAKKRNATPEYKEAAAKARADPEVRKRHREASKTAHNRQDVVKRHSEASKKRMSNPENRKRLAELAKARWADPEFRAKMAELNKERKAHKLSQKVNA